jgi:thiol-disulfide isomerase/thioredoxin
MNIFKQILRTTLLAFLATLFISNTLYAKNKSEVQSIELNTTKGEPIHITVTEDGFLFDKYKGKAVLLDFFGPFCPPCLLEIPHLIEMQKENKDKLQIIGVQVQTQMSNDELNAFVKEKGINYPVVNLDYAWDLVSFIRANTGWKGQIPYMLVFDKKGNLRRQFIGMVKNTTILKYIK